MKKQWLAVPENETVGECYQRLVEAGYQVTGRREVPIFEDRDGEPVPVKQQIEFCVVVPKDER